MGRSQGIRSSGERPAERGDFWSVPAVWHLRSGGPVITRQTIAKLAHDLNQIVHGARRDTIDVGFLDEGRDGFLDGAAYQVRGK